MPVPDSKDEEAGAAPQSTHTTRQSTAHRLGSSVKGRAKRTVAVIDQWGESPPIPKSFPGGLLTVLFLIVMLAYSIYLYILYHDRPNVMQTSLHWSQGSGPFPMHLTCHAEHCFVSMRYDAAATGARACIDAIPREQLGQCTRLQPGDHIELHTCYSQFPGQGVLLRFGGAPYWQDLATKLGLQNTAMLQSHGFSIRSTVPGYDGAAIAFAETPLSSGSTMLKYVYTLNETVDKGEEGNERHEWFADQATSEIHSGWISGDPCGGVDSSLHISALRLAPDYVDLKVSPPEEFVMIWFGQIGGASEFCSVALFGVLIAIHKLRCCKEETMMADKADVEANPPTSAPSNL